MALSDQNHEEHLQQLAAQHQMYADAKTLYGVDILLALVIPLLLSLLGAARQEWKAYVGLAGAVALMLDQGVVVYMNSRKARAAKVQESFDSEVLELPWDTANLGERSDPEDVAKAARRYLHKTHGKALTDWYPMVLSDLPLSLARLICQRTNVWWEESIRKRYCLVFSLLALSVIVVSICIGVASHTTLDVFVLTAVVPSLPTLGFFTRSLREHLRAAKKASSLKAHVTSVWEEALDGKRDMEMLGRQSRLIQSALFVHRSQAPLVIEAFYRILRGGQEEAMIAGAQQFVAEAERARKKWSAILGG